MKKLNKITCMFFLALLFALMLPSQAKAASKRTTTLDLTNYTTTTNNNAEGWLWSPGSKTLFLKGVDIEVEDDYAIKLPEESITILLSGDNKLKGDYAAISSIVGIDMKKDQGVLSIRPSDSDASLDLTALTEGIQYQGDLVLDNFKLSFHTTWCFGLIRNITMNQMNITASDPAKAGSASAQYALMNVSDDQKYKKCSINLKGCYISEGGSVIKVDPYLSYIGKDYDKSATTIKIVKGNPPAVGKAVIKKFEKDYRNMTLYWTAPKYSNGVFEIYRSTKKSSGYKKIATTNNLTYTDKKLTFNKTYYYKIKCKNSKSQSYSPVKSAKTALATISYAQYIYGSSKDAISWSKVNGATGYKIYRASSKKGKYSLVYTAKKGSKISYSIKRPSKKKKYYYKIQAMRKQGKKTYYSDKINVFEYEEP